MKKFYIMPVLLLIFCSAASARLSLEAVPADPTLLRAALMAVGTLVPETVAVSAPVPAVPVFDETPEILPPASPAIDWLAADALPEPDISNLAKVDVNVSELLALPDEVRGGAVLILHTHGCESYTPTEKYNYKPSEDFRTTDTDFNVVRVGNEIEKALTENGITVIHDTTLCDEPSFNKSYSKSLAVAKKQLAENPDIKVILDVHRDSIEDEKGNRKKTIGGENTSQLMFVVGTDAGGAEHPLWRQNLSLALKLQQRLMAKYPSLCRPINLRSSRFNQQLSTGSLIVEVGCDANTLEEALNAARIFGHELGEYMSGK